MLCDLGLLLLCNERFFQWLQLFFNPLLCLLHFLVFFLLECSRLGLIKQLLRWFLLGQCCWGSFLVQKGRWTYLLLLLVMRVQSRGDASRATLMLLLTLWAMISIAPTIIIIAITITIHGVIRNFIKCFCVRSVLFTFDRNCCWIISVIILWAFGVLSSTLRKSGCGVWTAFFNRSRKLKSVNLFAFLPLKFYFDSILRIF